MVYIKMTVSFELVLSVVIQLIAIGVFIGVYKTSLAFMQDQIRELKEEMKRYNNILERMIKAESSIKAIWHQLDDKGHTND